MLSYRVAYILLATCIDSYTQYFADVLDKRILFNEEVRQRGLRIASISFSPVPRSSPLNGVCNPQIVILDQCQRVTYCSPWEAPGR
jgi:hypothetical protein